MCVRKTIYSSFIIILDFFIIMCHTRCFYKDDVLLNLLVKSTESTFVCVDPTLLVRMLTLYMLGSFVSLLMFEVAVVTHVRTHL